MASVPAKREALDQLLRPAAREALRHLELLARRTVEGFLHGIHRSKRKGVSTEFDHHKSYQPGDPLKHIDWKVSARHGSYFVKRYLEDTALTVRIVVDRSGSMRRSTNGGPSKYLQASRLAACLSYLILKERDAVAMMLSAANENLWLPASTTETHLVRILQALVAGESAAPDGLEASLRSLLDRGGRKGMVVVLSDLMFPPQPVQQQLSRLHAQGHEILIVNLRDPGEEDFPFSRWVQFEDLEVPGARLRVDAVPLKRIYREEFQQLVAGWQQWARRYDIHMLPTRTDAQIETLLSEYLVRRAEIG